MKKITLLAWFTIMVSMVSCKKDQAEKNADRLNGKWTLESVAVINYKDGTEVDRDESSGLNLPWEFRSDGTATLNLDSNVDVKWTATESVLSVTVKNNNDDDDSATIDFQIKSLSKSNLNLEFVNYEETENGVTYKSVAEYKLRKQ